MAARKHLALALVPLLLVGCGARWTEEQRALVRAGFSGGGGEVGAGGSPVAVDANGRGATTGTPTPGATPPQPGGSTSGGGGDPTVTEVGGAAAPGTSATLPCAASTAAPGITDDELVVGTINSLSGPVPGLGASHLAATQAYVAHRNANGGVCGRQVRLLTVDDGSDAGRNRSAVAELTESAFAIHAGIAAGGDGGVDVVEDAGVPVVGTAITPLLRASPSYFGVRPDSDLGASPKYRFLREQGVTTAAVVYIAAASAPDEAQRNIQQMESEGIQIVLELGLPLSTLSYDSAARAVANSGADYLFFLHAAGPSASMAQAMADANYRPLFADYIVAYGSNFIELGGTASEGAVSFIDTLPAEDGGAIPEQAAFLEWMAQAAPESVVDPFAALGWAGAKALFDTLEAVPGPLTREAYLAQLGAVGTYDAGGLLGPIDFSARRGAGCTIGMIVTNGAWQRLAPSQGFLC
jgi:branched-chain amino acid transport system substrate-binding protein